MTDSQRVALLTARDDLRVAVLRLAAVAGAEVDVVAASAGVRAVWRAAAAVVVGSDLVGVVAAAGLPRRGDVVVVTTAEPDDALWRLVVEVGAARLLIMPADDHVIVELMSDALDGARSSGSAIAVIGGCGGAGASTLAAGLALTSAREDPTILLDGDRFGGGLDVLLGAEQHPGARWPDLAGTCGRLGAAALSDSLPQIEGLTVLSWDRTGTTDLAVDAAVAVINAAIRGFASVVMDLPRRFEPASCALATAADVVVMVVPATVRATAAAAMVATQLLAECSQLRLVVRDPGAGRLAVAEVAEALGLPAVAALHSESSVAAAADRGEPPLRRPRGSLYDACRVILATTPGQEAA